MSDDIEIEEHDLLDDPTVRNVFPDISRLKQEILDYEYDKAPDLEDPEPTSTSLDSYFDNIANTESSVDDVKTFTTAPGDIQHNSENNGQHNGFIRGNKGIEMQICKNKIILGSKPVLSSETKPDHFEKNVKPYCTNLPLENFGSYLKTSSRYCNRCQILFPTIRDYNYHEKSIHFEYMNDTESFQGSSRVQPECSNKDEIETEKSIEEVRAVIDSKDELKVVQEKPRNMLVRIEGEKVNICLICHKQFEVVYSLKKHMMGVHKISKKKLSEVIKRKKPGRKPARENIKSVAEPNECFHCKKTFRSQHLLIEHIYSILETPKSGSDKYANKILIGKKTSNDKLPDSDITLPNKNSKSDLMPMPDKNIGIVSIDNKTRVFRCRFCLLYFKTTKYFLRHMANKHKMVKNVQQTKIAFDPKCKHCPKTSDDVDTFNAHLRKNHPNKVQEAIEKSRKVSMNSNDEKKRIDSKDHLQNRFYRCGYCFSYFTMLKYLRRHLIVNHKVMKMPKLEKVKFDPKCKYCGGTYPNAQRYNIHLRRIHHTICHKVGEISKKTSQTSGENIVSNDNIAQNEAYSEIYECRFCPIYFKTMKFFTRHLSIKHKVVNIPNAKKVEFNPNCKYCPNTFENVRTYNNHVYKHHPTLLNKIIVNPNKTKVISKKNIVLVKPQKSTFNTNKQEINSASKNTRESKIDIEYYRCCFCAMCFKSMRFYARHVRVNHKKPMPKAKKVVFDLKCKYCSSILNNTKMYNSHILRHYEKKPYLKTKMPTATKKVADLKGKTFYRCCYCSYYFNSMNIYNSHLVKKHKVLKVGEAKKIKFDPNCKYCPIESSDEITYNKHLHNCHRNRIEEIFRGPVKKTGSAKSTRVLDSVTKYTSESKSYAGPKSKTIEDTTTKAINNSNIVSISKSALFKCHKCDIHFLSIKIALDHANHMELLLNWKCSICNRIFKDNDRWLHEKQHSFSHVFTVYDLDTANISHILYKCSKCILHFDESILDSHHYECVSRVPQSYICKICDILIDCNAKIGHEYNHIHRHLTPSDFIIIDTNVVLYKNSRKNIVVENKIIKQITDSVDDVENLVEDNNKKKTNLKRKIMSLENIESKKLKSNETAQGSKNEVKSTFCNENDSSVNEYSTNQKKYDRLLLKLSFCNTCKSFVSCIGQKRKQHALKRCANLKTQICKECGLRLSCKTLSTHRQMHLRITNLQLQNFKFYDFKSGKRLQPPMPEYEKCGICNVNFISKSTLGHHICSDNEYKTCDVCNIKVHKPVFHLHIAFHKYIINDASSSMMKYQSNDPVVSDKKVETKTSENVTLILYSCKVCKIFVDKYDRLIEHCQEHCLDTLSINTEECQYCNLKFQENSLTTHAKLHEKLIDPHFEKIYFDPFYFRFDSKVWLNHVFGSRPKNIVQDMLVKSVYRYEHRFKFDIEQEGRFDLTLYKCDKCDRYVEPDIIYHHIENSCSSLRKYPCPICHLNFISSFSLTRHKSTHSDPRVSLKSYRMVHFNKQEHAKFNAIIFSPPKLYVLYQCRHCNGIVDCTKRNSHICDKIVLKSCTDCGLLISEDLYEAHISKHKTLDSFIPENMKVILFGSYELHDRKNNSTSLFSFRGKVHDYTFYKCRKCQVCLKYKKSTSSHMCRSKGLPAACSKCGHYFYTDMLIAHIKSHETDPDLILDNMVFIDFSPFTSIPKVDELKINHECGDKESKIQIVSTENAKESISVPKQGELKVNDESDSVDNVNEDLSMPKEDELKLNYERVDEECALEIDSVENANDVTSKPEEEEINNERNITECTTDIDSIESVNDTVTSVYQENILSASKETQKVADTEKIADIYSCSCGLHFLDESSITEHISQCRSKAKQAKQNCSKCGLLFTPSVLFKHLLTHHGDKHVIYKFNIIKKSECLGIKPT